MGSTNTETTNNDIKSLEKVPTSKVEVADIATYRSWVKTLVGDLIERGEKAASSIEDNTSMMHAAELGKEAKSKANTIEKAFREQVVQPRHALWKESTTFINEVVVPLRDMAEKAEVKITKHRLEVEWKRKAEEEARLAEIKRREEEDARKKAEREEEERRRKEEYEKQLLETKIGHEHEEAKREDEWRTREKDRLAKIEKEKQERIKREEDARIAHAEAAKAEGEDEKSEAILDTPTAVEPLPDMGKPEPKPALLPSPKMPEAPKPLPEPEPEAPKPLPIVATPAVEKIPNAATADKYKGEVTNVVELMKWMIGSGMDPTFLKQSMDMKEQPLLINHSWINKKAQKMKTKLAIPGVRAVPEAGTTLRS